MSACSVNTPKGVDPVTDFDADRYLGKWYEIARMDHRFERGMSRVSAEYRKRDDGGIRVINRGYKDAENQWKEAEGKAYFVKGSDTGFLKVSFFGPFYGAYVVFALDQAQYQYALVAGDDRSYLWLLSRTPTISDELRQLLLYEAAARGFETDQLIWVDQSPLP